MTENDVKKVDIETVKHLLRQDLLTASSETVDRNESTFCEDDDHIETKIKVNRTYSRATPNKRILKSIENTPIREESPTTAIKRKRKNVETQYDSENIAKITDRFKKVEEFQLAVEK